MDLGFGGLDPLDDSFKSTRRWWHRWPSLKQRCRRDYQKYASLFFVNVLQKRLVKLKFLCPLRRFQRAGNQLFSSSNTHVLTRLFGLKIALHFTASKNNLSTARKLLSHRASARIKDKRGQLPLHRAAAIGSVPMVNLMLENKSPLNATDISGLTALHHCKLFVVIIEDFLVNG